MLAALAKRIRSIQSESGIHVQFGVVKILGLNIHEITQENKNQRPHVHGDVSALISAKSGEGEVGIVPPLAVELGGDTAAHFRCFSRYPLKK